MIILLRLAELSLGYCAPLIILTAWAASPLPAPPRWMTGRKAIILLPVVGLWIALAALISGAI